MAGMASGTGSAMPKFNVPSNIPWPATGTYTPPVVDTVGTPGSGVGKYAPQTISVLPRVSPTAGPDVASLPKVAIPAPEANPAFRSSGASEDVVAAQIARTMRNLKNPENWTEQDWLAYDRGF